MRFRVMARIEPTLAMANKIDLIHTPERPYLSNFILNFYRVLCNSIKWPHVQRIVARKPLTG